MTPMNNDDSTIASVKLFAVRPSVSIKTGQEKRTLGLLCKCRTAPEAKAEK